MARDPKITANITTNERSLNLIKLTVAVTKVAIPAIIAHIPTITISGVPGRNLATFLPRISAIKKQGKLLTIHRPIFQVLFSGSFSSSCFSVGLHRLIFQSCLFHQGLEPGISKEAINGRQKPSWRSIDHEQRHLALFVGFLQQFKPAFLFAERSINHRE
jgi:hypothetical protein